MRKKTLLLFAIATVTVVTVYWVGTDLFGFWLPYKLPWQDYQQEYVPPAVSLSNVSHSEAARELMSAWLNCYKSPKTEPYVRLRGYKIKSVSELKDTKDGFVCLVTFDLKPYGRIPTEISPSTTLTELKTYWISGNGIIKDRLIVDKMLYIWVKVEGSTYTIVDMGTCPPELADPV